MARSGFDPARKDRLRQKFRNLPRHLRNGMEAELDAAAEMVAEAIRARVPVRKGAGGGALKKSVRVVKGRKVKETGTLDADIDLVRRVVEGDRDAYYASMVEHGTSPGTRGERAGPRASDVKQNIGAGRKVQRSHPGTAAQPHFFPTWRQKKRSVRSRLSRAAKKAIAEATK